MVHISFDDVAAWTTIKVLIPHVLLASCWHLKSHKCTPHAQVELEVRKALTEEKKRDTSVSSAPTGSGQFFNRSLSESNRTNNFIIWRTVGSTIELIEQSLCADIVGGALRIAFPGESS